MAALVSVLTEVPDDPMQPEWIVIQSKGMKQWISLQIAEKFGVCANTNFVFPRQMVEHILTGFDPKADQIPELNRDVLFWAVLKQINEPDSAGVLSGISEYIRSDTTGKKECQLALKIAGVFDDYQVYRPEMLLGWLNEKQSDNLTAGNADVTAGWQAALFKKIITQPDDHPVKKIQSFLDDFSAETNGKTHFPKRISLFGISALPVKFLQVFDTISSVVDVRLFSLIPSNQFFFDVLSPRQMGKIALESDSDLLYFETGNPLLSSLGTSVQHFCSILESFDYQEPAINLFEDPSDPANPSMLTQLQSDILHFILRKRNTNDGPVPVSDQDRSIRIQVCHSPMRETQVLKDLLLDEFDKDPDLFPHDVIVMMPDIEAYAPFIEAVFGGEHGLPFAVSDRRNRSESEVINAFLKILALKDSRFDTRQVLDLLLSNVIADRFNITPDDIGEIEQMVKDANILWGKDGQHRKSLDLPPFEENTWQFGLDRLFMGMAMPEDSETLVADILPCPGPEGLDLDILGRFAHFCHTLFTRLDSLDSTPVSSRSIGFWTKELRKIVHALLDENDQTAEDLSFLLQTIDQIEHDALEADFSGPISFASLSGLIEQKLNLSIAMGNFMAGRITFCNIMPMRSIPFKIVVLMGMDEQSFPRKIQGPGFDLIRKFPQKGDKIQRDEDRCLFLESLLSARSRFIITYTGMNIQDNSLIPCSGVVSELLETMDQSFVFPDGFEIMRFHPLHPFDDSYFTGPSSGSRSTDRALFSYSSDFLQIAQCMSSKETEPLVFVKDLMEQPPGEPLHEATLEQVIGFFKNPLKTWVREGLNVQIPLLEEQRIEREKFTIAGLDQYIIGSRLLEQLSDSQNSPDRYAVYKAAGCLPFGEKGRTEYLRIHQDVSHIISTVQQFLKQKPVPPLRFEKQFKDIVISGNFPDIRKAGRYVASFGTLNGARLISAWISHLFLNCCAPDGYPKNTIVAGRDPSRNKPAVVYFFRPLGKDGLPLLEKMVQLFAQGCRKPVYLFCETAWQFVQALSKKQFDTSPESIANVMNQSKIKTAWQGSTFQAGERQERYISLCVENNDPFDSLEKLFVSGFVNNALSVYQPLLENLEIQS